MKALLIGMEWFPNRAGGLNRYFYEEVHALPAVNMGGTAVVTDLQAGQTAPLPLRAMCASTGTARDRRIGVRRVVREELNRGVEVVNAHFALYTYPWLRDLPAQMPLVFNFQGPWADEMAAEQTGWKSRLRVMVARRIEKKVYARADRIITLSDAFAQLAHTRYGVPHDRLRVIPGAVDTKLYTSAPERSIAREQLGWPLDRPILLAIRRLARRMGLENLLDAIHQIRKQHPRVLLLIGGKGALAGELQTRIIQLGLTDHVRLLGFVPQEQLSLAYAAADLTLVPTVALEGFGLITVESLAAGTPVMGTPVGGTPEILHGLNPDLVFSASTAAALAEGLDAALSGRVALPDRSACRAYATRYDWEVVAPRIRDVFEEARAVRAKA